MPPPALPLVDCRATLGEGLVWSPRFQAWLWTDIEASRIWRHDPASGTSRFWTLPDRCGAFTVCRSGRLLVGLAKGLAWATLDPEVDAAWIEPLVAVEADQTTTRINDGRTDRHGRFVFGTMNEADGHAPIGHFYQFSVADGLRRMDIAPVGISNSICFSPDGGTLYFCDLTTRRIMQAGYDSAAARVWNARPFAVLGDEQGWPDGAVIDSEGALWNAEWGGARVRRYSADGAVLATAPVPAENVTCPAFGGPALDRLCVTTARSGLAAEALEVTPQSGGVFEIDAHGAHGIAEVEFADD